jgi:S-adenosyl-L-methionine hydrolase (adenosine-forming)
MAIITLTTDFGSRDGYVGAVKGVISRRAPDARIIDIAHDIPRGDIAHAAWVVKTSTPEFPDGTIHVVVVDPGVGGSRPGVIARVAVGTHWYVGPDNGVFAYLNVERAWNIADKGELAPRISPTFHGRDVFAFAAASLARGYNAALGELTALVGTLPWGRRKPFTGRVVHIDVYGNLITDLPPEEATDLVAFGDDRTIPIVRTYEHVGYQELLAYVGSAGTIEVAVRDGRAEDVLGAKRGDLVIGNPPQRHSEGPYR